MKLSFILRKDLSLVYDYLTDMRKFVLVHPIISQIDNIGKDRYLVHEELKIGIIPFSFTYPVTIEKNEFDKMVVIRATVFKITKIEMKFNLRIDNGYTIVDEEIQFNTPLPIKFFLKKVFMEQHEILFKNIDGN